MPAPHSELFFNFGDPAGEAQFISWHQFRHRTYDLLASQNGHSLPMLDLTGKIDHDWLHRHYVRHATHRQFAGNATASYLHGLLDVNPHMRTQWEEWLRIHALEHQALDQFYGIT
jgi:hypothetical protein